MRSLKRSSLLICGLAIAACGDGGGGGSGGKAQGGQSYGAIFDAVSAPTGTVDEATAPDIATEFEKINSSSSTAKQKQAGAQETACNDSGAIRTTYEGNESSARSNIVYDNCCVGGCCSSGEGVWYFSTEQTAEYSYCGTSDLEFTCTGSSEVTTTSYEGCASSNGTWVYVVRVGSKTYSATGSYSGGNGTLEVSGENGHFSCTYVDYGGSCTSEAGTFEF